ncbi:MAG: Gfo/Idh/MocA family oxidoreductase [Verrucomicrobiota bacterium]
MPETTDSPIKKLRVGVAGVGSIGKNHARIFSELSNADLSVIFDADEDRAKELADTYGCRAVTTLEDFADNIDAATVATPTNTHCDIGSTLLKAGKHVLIEKPITYTTEEAIQLVDLAAEHNRVLQVGHIERFNPVLAKLEEQLTEAKFIEAHRLSPFPNRSTDIGVVLDLMIHDIEIILHLVRSEIETIDAVGIPVLTKREDIANARLRFANGCVANITASRISPEKMRKIRVFQHDMYLSLDYQEQAGEFFRKSGLAIDREQVTIEKEEPLKLELAAFVDCAEKGARPKVSGNEAAAALKVAIAVTRKIEEGGGIFQPTDIG